MQIEQGSITEVAKRVKTKKDFERFLRLLIDDHQRRPEAWENGSLGSFLEGLRGFAEDVGGYRRAAQEEEADPAPSWELFATMLLAARVYE